MVFKNPIINKRLVLVSFLLVLFSGLPLVAKGVVLYLEPAEAEYQIGDTFLTEARIDTEGECINTIKAELEFSKDSLEAVDFSQGSSIITIWLKSPEINQESGLVSFIGGIPGGYCGEIPGDPGPTHILGKIALQVSNEGEAKVNFLEGTQVLLNDGLGTPAELTTKEAIFTILPEKAEAPKNEWLGEVLKDKTAPEPFEIEIHQVPTIFDGKYFITFFTTDKQTGIDYFEILEGGGDWQRVESPYLLKDQELSSIIKVRAVDKAGNERIAEYIPKKPFPWQTIIIVVLVGAGVVWWIIKKILRKKL